MNKMQYVMITLSVIVMLTLTCGTVTAADVAVNPGGSIQTAINQASNNDTIVLNGDNGAAYTYTENVVVNKSLTLKSAAGVDVTVQAANPSNPVISVTGGGSGSSINSLTITGAASSSGIYLDSVNDCIIEGNVIENNSYGVYLSESLDNTIKNNKITSNNMGIFIEDSYYMPDSPNNILSNTITGNTQGIRLNTTTAEIHFNSITGNQIGVYINSEYANPGNGMFIGLENNWWGSNSPTCTNLIINSGCCDVYYDNIDVNDQFYENEIQVLNNPWLVLNVTANPSSLSSGESAVTADLTHNNQGNDTSSSGCVPDDLPVNFTTNRGTVTSPAYTRNGKATATFNSGSSGTADINVVFDNQTMQTNITVNMDTVAPTVTASPAGGTYSAAQTVTLTVVDDIDPNPAVYYTLDGSTPTTSSTQYTAPLNITTTALKFIAVDAVGNISEVQTLDYVIAPVININTGKGYSSIQDAINDTSTANGHTIEVASGTYTENVLINKSLTLRPVSDGNVIIHAANPSSPVFTVNSGGSGSTISGFNIIGATKSSGIRLNSANNCIIDSNNLFNNNYGVYLYHSGGNTITANSVTNNSNTGIFFLSSSNSNLISRNTVSNNDSGLYFDGSDGNQVLENIITGNTSYGFYLFESVGTEVHFNQISGNQYGLLSDMGSRNTNAQNNWWGFNNPSNPGDIRIDDGTVTYNPWLVLNVSADSASLNSGESAVTADLTHNNQGDDTSSSGCVPDDLPVNFTTNRGTITSPTYTRNGKATTTFNSGSVSSGIANIQATMDNQTKQVNITIGTVDTTPPTVTASPAGGVYTTAQTVTLTAADDVDPNPAVYYTLDGSTPTTSGPQYIAPINIGNSVTLKFMAVDASNNSSPVQTMTYTVGSVPTVSYVYPQNGRLIGLYNEEDYNSVVIVFSEPIQAGSAYDGISVVGQDYDGGNSRNINVNKSISGSVLTLTPDSFWASGDYIVTIPIDAVRNMAGNALDTIFISNFMADITPPVVTASPTGGNYSGPQVVALTVTDNLDPSPYIRYSTNGGFPNTTYTGPINITNTTTLKFKTGDDMGNISPLQTMIYTIGTADTTPPTVTASPTGGVYTASQSVTLTAADDVDPNPTVYYTLDGAMPTTSSTQYTTPINISNSVTLKFIAVDTSGNSSPVQTATYTIDVDDTTPPTVSASPSGGTYSNAQTVTLIAADNVDPNPVIYYTTDFSTPTPPNIIYTGPINVNNNTVLRFMAVDASYNTSPEQTEIYTITSADNTPPTVTASPVGGNYSTGQTVTLTATDNVDPNPVIYYTTNGNTPSTSSTLYTSPISIISTTMLMFFAVDAMGNSSLTQTMTYNIMDTTPPTVFAGPAGGTYSSAQAVYLSAPDNVDPRPAIYYTLNGSTPTTSSTRYTGPISVVSSVTLRFIAVDASGNVSAVNTQYYTIGTVSDTTPPMVYASPPGGNYSTAQTVYLTALDNVDASPVIYYTTDISTPTPNVIYTGPISVNKNTVLRFMAVDDSYNTSSIQTETYTLTSSDSTPPTVTASPSGGTYSTAQSVSLYASDNVDPNPAIYYALDGSTPTTSSMRYTGPISIFNTATLKFFAADASGNSCTVQNATYTINTGNPTVPVVTDVTPNNGEVIKSGYDEEFGLVSIEFSEPIQAGSAFNGINIVRKDYNGSNSVNVSINKSIVSSSLKLTLDTYWISGDYTVTVPSNAVMDMDGNSLATAFTSNFRVDNILPTVTASPASGNYSSRQIVTLTATDNLDPNPAIYYTLDGSAPTTSSTRYTAPISINNTTTLKFFAYDAAGNGSPYQKVIYTITSSDSTPPTVTASPSGGTYSTAQTVTLNATDNVDPNPAIYYTIDGSTPTTSSMRYYGSINISSTTTLKFFAVDVSGNMGAVQTQNYTIYINNPGNTITVTSTALDVSTGNSSLYMSYPVPLNNPTSWVSVAWKNTGMFQNEVDLIVNGNVVMSRTVVNAAYQSNKNKYSENVFSQISYLNVLFLIPLENNAPLQLIIANNPQLQGLTGSQLEDGILALVKQQNNFTNDDIAFIKNYRGYFIDPINVAMSYPGSGINNITITDPTSNETFSLPFPGSPISRTSPMVYMNGMGTDGLDAGYEGMRSFAIATGKVTGGVVQSWLDQKSWYPEGEMKAAYGTFLTALLLEYCHDVVADQAASKYNVSWSRTSAVVFSVCDDAQSTYMTGESDHGMGMSVSGDQGDVWAFRFACSSAISPLEYYVFGSVISGNTSQGLGSVTIGLADRILNGEAMHMFSSNGYLVLKDADQDDYFFIVDPVTGIVRDGARSSNLFCGVYCFHNEITERADQLARISIDPNLMPEVMNSINNVSVSLGDIAAVLGSVNYGGRNIATAELLAPVLVSLATIKFKEALQPGSIIAAENNGLFNSEEYLKNMTSQYWGASGPTQEFWDKLKEAGQAAFNEILPVDPQEKENVSTYIGPIATPPFTASVYGDNVGTDHRWIHVKVQRNPQNIDCWIAECSLTYYIGNKRHTETQYWVLLGGDVKDLIGGSHTFKFRLPYTEQGTRIADIQTAYYPFLEMKTSNI